MQRLLKSSAEHAAAVGALKEDMSQIEVNSQERLAAESAEHRDTTLTLRDELESETALAKKATAEKAEALDQMMEFFARGVLVEKAPTTRPSALFQQI